MILMYIVLSLLRVTARKYEVHDNNIIYLHVQQYTAKLHSDTSHRRTLRSNHEMTLCFYHTIGMVCAPSIYNFLSE